jgi:hypothetical protein
MLRLPAILQVLEEVLEKSLFHLPVLLLQPDVHDHRLRRADVPETVVSSNGVLIVWPFARGCSLP